MQQVLFGLLQVRQSDAAHAVFRSQFWGHVYGLTEAYGTGDGIQNQIDIEGGAPVYNSQVGL